MKNSKLLNCTDSGKCTGCGACCSNFLPMTEEEIDTIRKYIKKNGIKENKRFLPTSEPITDMDCPFLDTTKKCEKCMIYEVRPKICRDFICDIKQRPDIRQDIDYLQKAKIVFVREEFYGKN